MHASVCVCMCVILYRELASQQPGTQSALLLGDAYISIQEPDKAIEVYETALKKNPREATLASKIGQALVRTHHYNKVIKFLAYVNTF